MQYYRTVARRFTLGEHPTLRIRNRRGDLVIHGEDRDDLDFTAQISVHAESEREGEERLDLIELAMIESGDAVEIGPPRYDDSAMGSLSIFGIRVAMATGMGVRVDMHARVPRRCAVEAVSRSGTLRITGVRAPVTAESRSGRSELAEIAGNVRLSSRSGPAELRAIEGDVAVEARSGKVEIERVTGDVRASSRSGSFAARGVTGDVSVVTRSGRIRLEDIDGPVAAEAASGSVEVRGRIAHPVTIEVHSGSARIAVSRDSAFYMDAESRSGSVRSELPLGYLERPPANAPTVRVRAYQGSIRLVAL